ncbi:M23 family metallopeptidase [Cryobacterium sp. 10S3]|uniref:M23 family metallopeptidase n=1 Tax=Cryobacterium sp. 10S3 TaxID=3048582 RepID=UPI002AC99C95|nr:M23 family metallopeptidase [Cryobacterium sp. 10S3]MEB0286170.1 M23 family metallopeptidase [Cryobacterium sp. 10S3]WPX12228.1 M23 family metallopeptidase [Cryobacterium sp. 10S3]
MTSTLAALAAVALVAVVILTPGRGLGIEQHPAAALAEAQPAATSSATPAPIIRDGFASAVVAWPVDTEDAKISDLFGPRPAPCSGCTTNHLGVDFNPGAEYPIHAAAAGTVLEVAGPGGDYGWHVIIAHDFAGQQLETLYAHMPRRPLVSVGQRVGIGQQLGNVGTTGNSTGPHLHFELRDHGVPVDPLPWLYTNTRGATHG